ncbi:MAG: hypothetical protein RIC52_00310, partial [Amphiplicatus sp.]
GRTTSGSTCKLRSVKSTGVVEPLPHRTAEHSVHLTRRTFGVGVNLPNQYGHKRADDKLNFGFRRIGTRRLPRWLKEKLAARKFRQHFTNVAEEENSAIDGARTRALRRDRSTHPSNDHQNRFEAAPKDRRISL